MAKNNSVHLETGLRYESAGLLFRINIDLPEERAEDQGAALTVSAENLATGARVPFNNEASPALADFMAGYPRWMVRVGARATKGEDELTGTLRSNATVEELLNIANQLGAMIDQRFSMYKESVLA